ncbi:MAG: hypothetical protein F4105_07655 [Gemmatimonadetes bacterium]|nr:hypothetical protein [Gemmatimonadota bacterium]
MRPHDFDRGVALPAGLTVAAVSKAADYIERSLADLTDIYFDQANLFSGLVGGFGARALDSHSVYEKHRHRDTAAQRFPDLRRRGSPDPPAPRDSLESKASIRAWQLQAHYDHAGWYVVWRYLVDPTETYEPGRPVIVWRIDIAFLEQSDWKYEGSGASSAGGGRTETFGLIKPAARLKGCAVYARSDVVLRGGKPVPANGDRRPPP